MLRFCPEGKILKKKMLKSTFWRNGEYQTEDDLEDGESIDYYWRQVFRQKLNSGQFLTSACEEISNIATWKCRCLEEFIFINEHQCSNEGQSHIRRESSYL